MAVGKSKVGGKGGKKGQKKKIVDPFSRKEWYTVKTPYYFKEDLGNTFCNRTQGIKIASDSLKGRVFEASLADLQNDEIAFRKFKLICEDVQGMNLLTNFHGMRITTDKLRSMVKKWQTMIEAHCDVKTNDGYYLRFFAIGFTKKAINQVKKTTYAQTTQVKLIRKRMIEKITKEVSKSSLKEVVEKLIPDSIAKDIEKLCQNIYPLHDVLIRKVKILKKPKTDGNKLAELYTEPAKKATGKEATTGAPGKKSGDAAKKVDEPMKVDRPDNYEPPILTTV